MHTTILYVSGLGDQYDDVRRFCLRGWRLWGVTAKLVPMTWYDGKAFDQKYNRITSAIDGIKDNSRIVVIGESAGATMALQVANHPRVSRVITLCGVARPTTPISSYFNKRAPALIVATRSVPNTSDYDVHSVRAVIDGVVGKKYSTASGAKQHTIWTVGHLFTILLCLTILAPLMVTIAKNQ